MPTRFRVEITDCAKADIEEIWQFIARDSVTEANKFIGKLQAQLRTLRRFPNRCPLIPENKNLNTRYRHFLYGKYRSIFRVEGSTVYVVRVIHGARLLDIAMLQ